jgi:hypothetical protein
MTWIDALWPLAVAVSLLLIPGGVVGFALGLRRIALIGLAPAFSISILASTAVVIAPLHIRWGLVPVIVATALAALVAWGIRRLVLKRAPGTFDSSREKGLTPLYLIGAAISAIAIGWRLMATIGSPSNISQTYDAVFHLNAVRYVMDSGIASSLTLSGLPATGIERAGFYPGAWHDFASLVALTSGSTIPVAVSSVTVAIGAIAWPLSLLFLVRTISGPRRYPLLAGGVIATGFAAFPYLMMDYGVLYAFMLGLALLPVGWALATTILGFTADAPLTRLGSGIVLAAALPGITLAHPSVTMAIVVLCAPMVLILVIRWHVRLRRAQASLWKFFALYGGAVALAGVVALVFYKLQPGNFWKPQSTWLQGLYELVFDAPVKLGPAAAISLLVTVGLVVALLKTKQLWLALSWVLFAGLFLVTASVGPSIIRAAFTGMWYGDVYRLAALLAIVEAPLAVIGLVWLFDGLRRLAPPLLSGWKAWAAKVLVLALALVAVQFSNLAAETHNGRVNYTMSADAKLLTPDELTVLDQVDKYVRPDQKTIGNPWTGASLVYAIANRVPVLSRPGVSDTKVRAISQNLQNAATNPAVCQAVRELNVRFVLDFGSREIFGEKHLYAGITDLANNPSVTLVTKSGDASLWKITACK